MKKTLKTRILSGVMAGVLATSLAVPAFASNNVKITGTYQDTPISVVVPTTGTAQINPYALNVKLDDTSSISGNQIVTKPLAIVNKSDMDLTVSAQVTAETKGDFKFGSTASQKTGVVYLQLKDASTTLNDTALAAADATDAISGLDAAKVNAAVAAWGEFDATAAATDSASLLLVDPGTDYANPASTAKKPLLNLSAVDSSSTNNKKIGGVALFRLAGEVDSDPTEAWVKADGFAANIVFSFAPVKALAITMGNVEVDGGAATGSDPVTISASVTSAKPGVTVTLSQTGMNSSDSITYTVTTASGKNVALEADGTSFIMPSEAVTVTAAIA